MLLKFPGKSIILDRVNFIVWILIAMVSISQLQGQDKVLRKELASKKDLYVMESYYMVSMKNSNKFIGLLTENEIDSNHLVFQVADSSYVKLALTDVNKISLVDGKINKYGKFRLANKFAHRYFFGASAFNIKKNDIYFSNTILFYNNLEYGITDHFSVNAGLNLYPILIDDYGTSIYVLNGKLGGWKLADKIHVGLSYFYGLVNDMYNDEKDIHNSLSGLITFGSEDNNFTLGLGRYSFKGYFSGFEFGTYIYEYQTNRFATINLNAMFRLTNSFYLLTENWIVNSDKLGSIYSIGGRYSRNKLSVDLALIKQNFEGNFYYDYSEYYPYLNVSFKF